MHGLRNSQLELAEQHSNANKTALSLSGDTKAMMSDMYVHGNDVEGKPLQEDLITKEAASKSVHVLGQGEGSIFSLSGHSRLQTWSRTHCMFATFQLRSL